MSICVSSLPQAASNEGLRTFRPAPHCIRALPFRDPPRRRRGEYMNAKIAATASTSAVPEANLLCRERKPPILPS